LEASAIQAALKRARDLILEVSQLASDLQIHKTAKKEKKHKEPRAEIRSKQRNAFLTTRNATLIVAIG